MKAAAAAAPQWTRARLERAMRLRFGSHRGGVDRVAVAAAMGVTPRTVQRWLHTKHGRSIAPIPSARLEQFLQLLRPDSEQLVREAQQARYAAHAVRGLGLGRGRGIKKAWQQQRWLEPHAVVVLEVKLGDLKIRQLTTVRQDRLAALDRRGGRVVDAATVPTRFHATLLVHETLTELAPWRFHATPGQVAQAFTQAWIVEPSTPRTHLKTAAALITGRSATEGQR